MGSKRGPGCGQGLGADLCVSPGVSLTAVFVHTWGPTPKHLVQVELEKVCAALASLVGHFGLLPRLSQEFRGPLSQWFEEVFAFLEGSSLRDEVWGSV